VEESARKVACGSRIQAGKFSFSFSGIPVFLVPVQLCTCHIDGTGEAELKVDMGWHRGRAARGTPSMASTPEPAAANLDPTSASLVLVLPQQSTLNNRAASGTPDLLREELVVLLS
jgi:hypothetical protein